MCVHIFLLCCYVCYAFKSWVNEIKKRPHICVDVFFASMSALFES